MTRVRIKNLLQHPLRESLSRTIEKFTKDPSSLLKIAGALTQRKQCFISRLSGFQSGIPFSFRVSGR